MVLLTGLNPIMGNDPEKIEHKGKIGVWLPPEYAYEYFELQKKYPIAQEKIKVLEKTKSELSKEFDSLKFEYEKIRRQQAILIGFTIGSSFITISIISGIITYCVLNYYNKYP